MSDNTVDRSLHVYEYGEAYDDLQAAFYIDERSYPDPVAAQIAVESAEAAMARTGVIYEVEVTSGAHAHVPVGLPTWEEFRQRHFIEGVPLPVRPPSEPTVPPSWNAMVSAVDSACVQLREELTTTLTAALPESPVEITADRGPLRRSPSSVDWTEEKYGFEIVLTVGTGRYGPVEALRIVGTTFEHNGWQLSAADADSVTGHRDHVNLLLQARPTAITVVAESPLYSAPPGVDGGFVVEER